MRHSYDQSEYTRPGEEFSLPPEQSATLHGRRTSADRFGVQKRNLAEPNETERQAAEVLAEEGPAGEAAGEELTVSAEDPASADAKQTAERKEKRRRSLLLQFAAVASSVVLVTNSFGIDFLGMDGLFNDSVILGELSTEPDDGASGHYDDEFDLIYGDLIPFGGDRVFPRLDNNDWTVTQDTTVDANNQYIAAVDFINGSMGEQAMVEGFVWYGRKEPKFYTGPIPMSIPENPVSAENSSIHYDFDTNTLTLNNYHGKGLMINNMGQDFTIRLEGDSVLSEYLMVACGSVTITGDGGITINESEHYNYGIHVIGQWTKAHLMLDEDIKFDISGAHSIFRVTSTCSEKPVCYKTPHPWGEIYQGQLRDEDRSIIRDDPETYHSWLMVGVQTHSTIVHVNNSYRPDGRTDIEPSSEAPAVKMHVPVGGDSAFPILPNPMPDSVGADGIVHASQILVWEKENAYSSYKDLDIYSNQQHHPTGRDDIFYDPASNTLTLNNYSGGWIEIRSMGSAFKIRLIGTNTLDSGIKIFGDLTSGSVTFTGDGYLYVNRKWLSSTGIFLDAGNAAACIMIDSSVSMYIKGDHAIEVWNTSAEKPVYYLSDTVPDLFMERDSGESAPTVPGTFYDWLSINTRGDIIREIHIGGEEPPETEPSAELPGLPIGGDASYPNLPNLEPGGTSPDGVRYAPQIIFFETPYGSDFEQFYLPDYNIGPMNTNSLSYDPASNTLTMNNYSGGRLEISNMGNGFTIRLIGRNVLNEGIHLQGDYLGSSIHFTGDGYLSLNSTVETSGLTMRGIYSETCLMIDSTVTMDLYGSDYAFWISDTSAEKAVYYASDEPLEGVRQYISGSMEEPSGTVPGMYSIWYPVDNEGKKVNHIHIGGEVPEDPELPGIPVGGDSSFPDLPNPNPNSPVPGYGVINEDYVQAANRATDTYEFIYFNPAYDEPTVSREGISYDPSTNTLTLNNYHGGTIFANLLGNSFTVELIGENELTEDFEIWGFYTGGSVHFTGSGSLAINTSRSMQVGLILIGEYSPSCIMIDSSVTLDIYAAATVIEVQNTSAEKAIYLLSDSPLDDVRQYVVMETLPDTDVIAQVPYQVWHLVDDSFTPITHLHIEGKSSLFPWFGR